MPKINELLPRKELEDMSRRERKKQETRWRIYEAAITLFSKRDYDSVKIEDICEEADVSNAAFFHHFSNKASLVRGYLEILKINIRDKIESAKNDTSAQKLTLISHEIVKANEDTAHFSAQIFNAITSGDAALDMEHINTGITGTLTKIIREGQDSGEFNKTWQPEVVAASLIGAWAILPLAAKSPFFPKHPYDELMKVMLTGLNK
jgi:AcrR family transcriptional regulator